MAFIYILKCRDGSLYVGSTKNLDRRLSEHSSGLGAEYTKRRRPVALVYEHEFDRVDDAYFAEKQVQGWGRAKRLALIEGRFDLLPALAKKRFPKGPVE